MQESEESNTEADPDIASSAYFSHDDIEENSKKDISLLGGLAAPNEVRFKFPLYYYFLFTTITNVLKKKVDFTKFALALPRGHGKTFVVKLLILWTILFSSRRFIILFGATQEHAANIIRDVCSFLSSKNIRVVFGHWDIEITKNATELKIFYFRGRKIILKAEGAGTASRGINIDDARPDFMIFDDAQTKDCAESPTGLVALKFLNWFQATLKAKDPHGCTFLYVGNMYKNIVIKEDPITKKKLYGCVLRNLKDDPEWTSLITGAILVDGTALWEELHPIKRLLAEYRSDAAAMMSDIFFAEVQNDPDAKIHCDFNFKWVPENPYEFEGEDIFQPDAKFLVIDPSLGTTTSDSQIVSEFWVYDTKVVFRRILPKERTQVSAPELVRYLLTYCQQYKIPLVISEAYAYQKTLVQWLTFIASQINYRGTEFKGISRGMKSKASAIQDWLKTLIIDPETGVNSSIMYLHSDVRSHVFSQISQWDKTASNNTDDIMDTGYYGGEIKKYPDIFKLAYNISGELLKSNVKAIHNTKEYK